MERRAMLSTRNRGGHEAGRPTPAGRPAPGARAALLLVAALLAVTAGCGLFKVRDPMAPIDEGKIPHHTATDPESVLFNFSTGFSYKTIGESAIRTALSDDFHFVLDPSDLIDVGVSADSLTKSETVTGLDSFFKSKVPKDDVTITFDLHDVGVVSKDYTDVKYYWYVPYEVRISSGGNPKQTYGGKTNIYFKRPGSVWLLYSWVDIYTGTATLGGSIKNGSGHVFG
jgi:hypothetical protein